MAEKHFNYRAYYKKYYDIDFDKDFAIHHIDFDRNNNDMDNLLLLPRGLHGKYHMCLAGCGDVNHKISGIIGDVSGYSLTSLKNFSSTLIEIDKWVKWKKYNYDHYLGSFIFGSKEECPCIIEVKK